MNKTALIFRHEFFYMIKRTGFIIMTLALPVLALLAIGVYQIVSKIEKPVVEQVKIGYVDNIGSFTQFTAQQNISLIRYGSTAEAVQALNKKSISEYFVIPADYVATGVIDRFTPERQLEAPAATATAIRGFLLGNLLQGKAGSEIIQRVETPLNLVTTRITETGAPASQQGGYESFIIPYLFSILLVISIFASSGYLLQGLGEEKENRIMEILLSSVSTTQLLTGKVLGLGAAGLVQVIVWLGSAVLMLNLASSTIGGFISTIHIPSNFIVLGIVYFILGYLMFAVISAGVGAVSPTAREGQQLSAIFTVAAIIPFYFMPLLINTPDNPVSTVLTLFPITAPVTVMARLGLSDIAPWELAASIILLIGFIIGGLWFSAKIFRTYLLMYGKRPGLKEIAKSLRG